MTTKPILWSGEVLKINADVEDGAIRVGIDGDRDRTTSKCMPITDSLINGSVKWDGAHDMADLNGSAVRLRFEIKGDAKIYSFSFTN